MIFEFSKMEDTVIPNFYGGEKQISAKTVSYTHLDVYKRQNHRCKCH